MGKFRENNRNGGGFNRGRDSGFGGGRSFGNGRGRSFGGNRGGGRFERRPVEMHDATCSKCGKACQIPFKPRGDKPVYCSACFETEGQTSPRFEKSSNSQNSASSGISQEQFKQLNSKLDKILAVLSELEIDSGDEDLDSEEFDEDEDDDDSEN